MSTPRRFYTYAVSAVSLQAVTQALIALLRNLLVTGLDSQRSVIAFQIAVIVIGLPIFLAHWLWVLRLARRETAEQEAVLRRIYLFGMQAAFLGPFVNSAFNLVGRLLAAVTRVAASQRLYPQLPTREFLVYHFVGVVVLALLWFYHQRVLAEESSPAAEAGGSAAVRRLYVYGFSAAGLAMSSIGVITLLRWILYQFGAESGAAALGPVFEIARLIVGVPLWLIFWRWAERSFAGVAEDERASALRKFYLFSVVFLAALTAVTTASILLSGFFRDLLRVGGDSQGDPREAIAIIVAMLMLWIYHGLVLREDTRRASESQRQAGVRRLYAYLVAAIGLSAALVGLAGLVSVLILSLERSGTGPALKEQLAWSAAALIAGLPVWGWPWRGAQVRASSEGSVGDAERRSIVRKLYLYFYLLLATLTVLSSAVYLLSRFLGILLGEKAPGLSELGHPIAFGAIAAGLWLYDSMALRADRRLEVGILTAGLEGFRVAVVDVGAGSFGKAVVEELKSRIPGIAIVPILLGASTDEAPAKVDLADQIRQAGLIIGPWTVTVAGQGGGAVTEKISRAIIDSPARKLLVPAWVEGYEWAGVDRWQEAAMIRQVVSAAKQMLQGEEVKPARTLGAGAIIGIVLGGLLLLILLGSGLLSVFSF